MRTRYPVESMFAMYDRKKKKNCVCICVDTR